MMSALARKRTRLHPAGVVAVLDVGSSKVSCLIASVLSASGGADIEIVGVGRYGVLARDARRDRASALETAVRGAVDAAERMAGERIQRVHVPIGGRFLTSRRIGVDLDLAGDAVTREDVVDCLEKGAGIVAGEGASPLHALAMRFAVDGEDAGANPCGLLGGVLTCEMLGLAVREGYTENLRALLERCDLAVDSFFAAPLASAEAVLIEDEKELGVIVVDIGARFTEFAVFEDGAAVACGGVGVGGDHLTRDIAQIFGGAVANAERVKTLHGSAISGPGDDHRFIDFPQLGEAGEVVKVSRAEVAAVIAPRLEEIFTLVETEATRAVGRRSSATGGLRRAVLTGGGSLMTGARETAERVLGVRTRLGRAAAIAGSPDAASAPQYAVSVGGILLAAGDASRWRAEPEGFLARDFVRGRSVGVLRAVADWLKVNF